MPNPPAESTLLCPDCRSPVDDYLDFCHTCGCTMVAQPSSRPNQAAPNYILLASGLVALAFLVIMGLTIYDFVHQYGVPGGADVSERATRYLSEGQEESAINLLQESVNLKSNDKSQQVVQWQALLDKALYAQGKKLAAQGKFRDAVTSFARISPEFAGHEEVASLITEYSERGMPLGFGKVEENDGAEPTEKLKMPLSRIEKAVMTAVPGGKEHAEPLSTTNK